MGRETEPLGRRVEGLGGRSGGGQRTKGLIRETTAEWTRLSGGGGSRGLAGVRQKVEGKTTRPSD